MSLALKTQSGLDPRKPGFDARVADEGIFVPRELEPLLQRYRMRSIFQLLSRLEAFPAEASEVLKMSPENVNKGLSQLKVLLHQTFPDEPAFGELAKSDAPMGVPTPDGWKPRA